MRRVRKGRGEERRGEERRGEEKLRFETLKIFPQQPTFIHYKCILPDACPKSDTHET